VIHVGISLQGVLLPICRKYRLVEPHGFGNTVAVRLEPVLVQSRAQPHSFDLPSGHIQAPLARRVSTTLNGRRWLSYPGHLDVGFCTSPPTHASGVHCACGRLNPRWRMRRDPHMPDLLLRLSLEDADLEIRRLCRVVTAPSNRTLPILPWACNLSHCNSMSC
jgi:hypothetical protein